MTENTCAILSYCTKNKENVKCKQENCGFWDDNNNQCYLTSQTIANLFNSSKDIQTATLPNEIDYVQLMHSALQGLLKEEFQI